MADRNFADKRELVRRMMRARTKAYRYFHENEKGTSETLAKYTNLEYATALETYRLLQFDLPQTEFLTIRTWKLC